MSLRRRSKRQRLIKIATNLHQDHHLEIIICRWMKTKRKERHLWKALIPLILELMFPLLLSNNSYKLILILIKQILPMEKNSR
jgi:hypothetical protein